MLSKKVRQDIQWWIENLMLSKRITVMSPPPQLIITSDAFLQGWSSLSGTNNRRSMDSRGTGKPSKYTRAEDSQIAYFNIYPYAPRTRGSSLTNGQYCGSASERDHIYCRVNLGFCIIK